MTIQVTKEPINLREKLNELETNKGLKGNEILQAETAQEVRSLIGAGRKNLIINGDMRVAQRGTSNTNVTSSSYLNMDRYETDISSAGTWTISQDSDTPSGFGSSFKFLCTTADASISGTDRIAFRQKIEGQNLQQLKKGTANAEPFTVSFWVKSNKIGTYINEVYDYDNSRYISKSYTINAANTWEQKSITFAGDTTGALDNDSNASLHLHFWLAVGSGFSSGTLQTSWGGAGNTNRAVGQVNLADSTSNYLNITGVQLELGSVATDFEHRSYGEELALCQRYYQRLDVAHSGAIARGQVWNTTSGYVNFPLSQPLRAYPTALTFNNLSVWGSSGTGTTGTLTLSIHTGSTKDTVRLNVGGKTNLGGAGQVCSVYGTGATSWLALEAEL